MKTKILLLVGALSGVVGAIILSNQETTFSIITGGILLVGGMISVFLGVINNRIQK